MRFNKFRTLSLFTLTALVTGAFALPTRAKDPIQTIQPLLIATTVCFPLRQINATTLPPLELVTFIPVTSFVYNNGEVQTTGTLQYGFLGLNSCNASAYSPAFTISNLKSLTVNFDYTSTGVFYVELYNLTQNTVIRLQNLGSTDGNLTLASVTIPPMDLVPGNQYEILFETTGAEVKFSDVTLLAEV